MDGSAAPPFAIPAPASGAGSRWSPFLAKFSAVLGLCFAILYGGCLAVVLRGLYSPAPGEFCGTPVVGALALGAFFAAPTALVLAAVIFRFRAAIAGEGGWRAVSLAALVLLVVTALTNWIAVIPFVAL